MIKIEEQRQIKLNGALKKIFESYMSMVTDVLVDTVKSDQEALFIVLSSQSSLLNYGVQLIQCINQRNGYEMSDEKTLKMIASLTMEEYFSDSEKNTSQKLQ